MIAEPTLPRKCAASSLAVLAILTGGASAAVSGPNQIDPVVYNSTGFDLLEMTARGASIIDATTGILNTKITGTNGTGTNLPDSNGEDAVVVSGTSSKVVAYKDAFVMGGKAVDSGIGGDGLWLGDGGAATLCGGYFASGLFLESNGARALRTDGAMLEIAGGSYVGKDDAIDLDESDHAINLEETQAVITGGSFLGKLAVEAQGGYTNIFGGLFRGFEESLRTGSSAIVDVRGGEWSAGGPMGMFWTAGIRANINVYGTELTRDGDQLTGVLCDGKPLNVSLLFSVFKPGNVTLFIKGQNFTDCLEPPTFPECASSCNRAALTTGKAECCGATLYDPTDEACCGSSIYNITEEACCSRSTYNIADKGCCNTVVYENSTQVCCEGSVKNGTSCDTECPDPVTKSPTS